MKTNVAFPIKLNDRYPCQGIDANGQSIVYGDLLQEGEVVGLRQSPDGSALPPYGTVVKRDDGMWIEEGRE